MRNLNLGRRILILGVVLSVVGLGAAFGQSTGNIYVSVTDPESAALPGVTVKVTGAGAPRTTLSDDQGGARFLALDPGFYLVNAELEGFGTVEFPNVEVRALRNTPVMLKMQPAVEEVITVTSESPLLDERRLSSGTTVTQVELEKIPTARDPWALLSQTPGVITDRINVGGNESGQQSIFRAPGASMSANDFMVDGVQITDMSAIGASPTYYDFDQFAEMSFTTGSTDVTKNTGGVQINMVTKRGTNEFRGSARFYNTQAQGYFGGSLDQSQPDIQSEICRTGCTQLGRDAAGNPTAGGSAQLRLAGAKIRKIEDIGFEAGGAVVRDHLWLWGSWGQNDVKQNAASGTAEDTILENTSIKVNAQFTSANSFVSSYNNGDKLKFGRGAGTTRPPETTWNQRGPSAIYKFEDTHVFSSSFFLTGAYSIVDLGFGLAALGPGGIGGLNPAAPNPRWDTTNVWRDNFQTGFSQRPGEEFKLDSSYFFGGGASHELKIGGRFRTLDQFSDFAWGPRKTVRWDNFGSTVYHIGETGDVTAEYTSVWAQDTITFGRFTINAGLRYDEQTGENSAYTRNAHPIRPDLLPTLNFPGSDAGFAYETITPRVGITYALGEDRNTLLRASFTQYASQMPTGQIIRSSPLGDVYAYVYDDGSIYYTGFDPDDPLKVVNRNDPGLDAEIGNTFQVGIEHAFLPEFVVGFDLNYGWSEDIQETVVLVDAGGAVRPTIRSDWVQGGTFRGAYPRGEGSYSVPFFRLRPGVSFTGGTLLQNGDREISSSGATVSFTKRLAKRWMARGYFSYLFDEEWDVPANFVGCGLVGPNNGRAGGCVDGDLWVERVAGSGKAENFLQSSWTYNLNGMYQIAPDRPWGFNVSANISGREGNPVAYYRVANLGTGGNVAINVATDLDAIRQDDPMTADVRIEKEFAATRDVNLTFGIDIFNVMYEGTGLFYISNCGGAATIASNCGHLSDNISPRIYRLGVRLSWK